METDGEVAAVEAGKDGKILRAMAIAARKLRYKGEVLVDADSPQDWARGGAR
jgi:hypothetical protein